MSFLPQNREHTLETLKLAGERGIVALKTTFLLGGNPDPSTWDAGTRELAEACFAAAEQHDLVIHFHTSPGGRSDINNFVPLVEQYGKRVKIYLVHFGGGVSGHIKLVPRFLDWVEQGYKVYSDTTWSIGFGPRWLLTEIERRGVGRTACCSPPTSHGATSGRVLEDLRRPGQRRTEAADSLPRNYEELYGDPRR